jgi:transposase
VTLTASNITDGNPNRSITQVTFYLDSNNDGQEDGDARRLGRRSYHSSSKEVTLSQAAKRGGDEREVSIFPPKTNAANETLAQHLWNHRDELFTFLRQPGLDATNWRAELAIRFGVILRKVWGGSRTWVGARTQSVLMSVWRTCWQQGRSALDFLSQLLRGKSIALALPP